MKEEISTTTEIQEKINKLEARYISNKIILDEKIDNSFYSFNKQFNKKDFMKKIN